MKSLYPLQTIILLGGAVFAWVTFVQEATPNPLLSMCFYGAVGFSVGLIWASYLLVARKAVAGFASQRYLTWFLVAGTAFAWGNFIYTAWQFYHQQTCTLGCPEITTLWAAPCLWGAILFTGALVAGIVLSRPAR